MFLLRRMRSEDPVETVDEAIYDRAWYAISVVGLAVGLVMLSGIAMGFLVTALTTGPLLLAIGAPLPPIAWMIWRRTDGRSIRVYANEVGIRYLDEGTETRIVWEQVGEVLLMDSAAGLRRCALPVTTRTEPLIFVCRQRHLERIQELSGLAARDLY